MKVRFTNFDGYYTVISVDPDMVRIVWDNGQKGGVFFEEFPFITRGNTCIIENLPQIHLKALKCYLQEE